MPAGIIAACTWHMRMEVSSSILHYTCRYSTCTRTIRARTIAVISLLGQEDSADRRPSEPDSAPAG